MEAFPDPSRKPSNLPNLTDVLGGPTEIDQRLHVQRSQLAFQSALNRNGSMDVDRFLIAQNFELDLDAFNFKKVLKPGDPDYVLPET